MADKRAHSTLARAWHIRSVGQIQMKGAITLLALLAGSAAVFAAEDTRLSPKRDDLVGVWGPDKESMREIESRTPNRMPPAIELRSQGSFAVDNIPSWWRNVFGQPSGKISGIAGARWDLKEGKNGPELLLQDQTFRDSMVLSIEGKKPPYFILLHVGGTTGNAPVRFYRKSRELNPNSFRSEAQPNGSAAPPQQTK